MRFYIPKPSLWAYCVSGVVLSFVSAAVWADCSYINATSGNTLTITVPATLKVPKNTSNGTEIYRSAMVKDNGSPTFRCKAGDKWGYDSSMGTVAAKGPSPIGDTGLGWRLVFGTTITSPYPTIPLSNTSESTYTFRSGAFGIRLYKMGNIAPGTISSGVIGTIKAGGLTILSYSLSNAIAITEVSCETPSVNVDLGKQRSSQFGAVGTTIGQKAFNIQLNNCPTGLSGISYRLDPVNTAFDAKTGVLALDEGGAKGVGIQITDANDKAVSLGEAHKFLSSAPIGNYTIPLKAAYYKTSDIVEPGIANASMQFTITYQ